MSNDEWIMKAAKRFIFLLLPLLLSASSLFYTLFLAISGFSCIPASKANQVKKVNVIQLLLPRKGIKVWMDGWKCPASKLEQVELKIPLLLQSTKSRQSDGRLNNNTYLDRDIDDTRVDQGGKKPRFNSPKKSHTKANNLSLREKEKESRERNTARLPPILMWKNVPWSHDRVLDSCFKLYACAMRRISSEQHSVRWNRVSDWTNDLSLSLSQSASQSFTHSLTHSVWFQWRRQRFLSPFSSSSSPFSLSLFLSFSFTFWSWSVDKNIARTRQDKTEEEKCVFEWQSEVG